MVRQVEQKTIGLGIKEQKDNETNVQLKWLFRSLSISIFK